jgi:hypothetical protein
MQDSQGQLARLFSYTYWLHRGAPNIKNKGVQNSNLILTLSTPPSGYSAPVTHVLHSSYLAIKTKNVSL